MILIPKNVDAVAVAVNNAREDLWKYSWSLMDLFEIEWNDVVVKVPIWFVVGTTNRRMKNHIFNLMKGE